MMSDPNPKPRRFLNWLLYACIAAIAVFTSALAILPLLFRAHAIPPEAQTPPPKILTIKPATNIPQIKFKPPVLTAKNSRDYRDALTRAKAQMLIDFERAKNPNSPLIDPFEKFLSLWTKELGNEFLRLRPKQWQPGQSPTDAQKKWLLEHKELIDALMQLAAAGGFPMITCEEAAAFSDDQLATYQIYTPPAIPICYIMIYEAQRLKDSGDLAGAVKTMIALDTLARSCNQPSVSNLLLSWVMKDMADCVIGNWIENTIPPEIALQLRNQFEKPWVNPRKVFELEYRFLRRMIVQDLNSSYGDMYKTHLSIYVHGKPDDPNFADKISHAFETAWYTVRTKAAADSVLREYDAQYGKFLDEADSDRLLPENSKSTPGEYDFYLDRVMPRYGNPQTDLVRKAQLNLDLAALDRIIDPEHKNPITRNDPFTGAPLKVVDRGDATLIYSIGPDLKDQLGLAQYDPSNWRKKSGDIVIRVPKRKEAGS